MQLLGYHEDQQGRGFSYELWKSFPTAEIFALRNPGAGFGILPNLASFDYAVDAAAPTVLYGSDGARGYIDTGCNIQMLTHAQGGFGGGIRLSTDATDNDEAWIQWGGVNGEPFLISDTASEMKDLIFEVAFRASSVTDSKFGFFIGLMENGSAGADTITDAGALKDASYIGFHRLEGDGDALDYVYKKNGQTAQTKKADWKTIAANTWYHVGFRFKTINKTIVPWFGTGDRSTTKMSDDTTNQIVASDISAATFPDSEGLSPIVGLKNSATEAASLDVRFLACAQCAPDAD